MRRSLVLLLAALLAACAHIAGPVSTSPWADAHEAAGGTHWTGISALRSRGRLSVGGLDGTFESLENVHDGQSSSHYRLGPIEGAEGYDGEMAWSRTGKDIVVEDNAEALARGKTRAWLTRRGYFQQSGAQYGTPRQDTADGRRHLVIEATPDGGSPIELWFDEDHLLVRTAEQVGQDRMITRYEDYRDVSGVRLPFRVVSEGNDPRNRTVVTFDSIEPVSDVPATAFLRPAAVPEDFAFADGGRSTTLPFDLLNNHIYVDGSINGQPVRLLFDTGGLNLLTPQAAARLGLRSEGRMAARGVGEEQVDVGFAKAERLELGALRLDAPLFYVMDLGDLPAVEGFHFDGLVGYEVFNRLGVRIDYANGRLTLTHPDDVRAPDDAIAIPFTLDGRIPVVEGEIDGLAAKLSIDTGSRASLSLHSPFVREHGLVERYGARFETVNGWGVGGPSRSWPVRAQRVRVGGAEVLDVVADLVTSEKGALANPGISANVGSGLLRRFVVDFDYRARMIHLRPGADHDYREHYDRAGMWLMRDADTLRIAATAPGGPAERAGLRVDDRIVSIGDTVIAARALVEWREFLRTTAAGTSLPIAFRRDGQEDRTTTLTLADLIAPSR